MSPVAAFIGEHAIASLLVASILMLIMTAIVWMLIERFWAPLWRLVARLWMALSRSRIGHWLRRVPLLRGSLASTLSVWRYLGVHAIASFAFAAAAISAFMDLADEIDAEEELARFDAELTQALQVHIDVPTLELFATITHLGDRNVTVGIGVLVGLYMLWRRWWLHAVIWGLATGMGGVLVRLLKHHFERTRPIHEHALTDATGWSFPSGHASGAMLVYGMLGYFIVRHTPSRWHIPITLLTIMLIAFVGFSRVILQVHYLSDVLAGFTVAGAWTALCVTAFEVVRRRADLRRDGSVVEEASST